jgi:hypothetical protein
MFVCVRRCATTDGWPACPRSYVVLHEQARTRRVPLSARCAHALRTPTATDGLRARHRWSDIPTIGGPTTAGGDIAVLSALAAAAKDVSACSGQLARAARGVGCLVGTFGARGGTHRRRKLSYGPQCTPTTASRAHSRRQCRGERIGRLRAVSQLRQPPARSSKRRRSRLRACSLCHKRVASRRRWVRAYALRTRSAAVVRARHRASATVPPASPTDGPPTDPLARKSGEGGCVRFPASGSPCRSLPALP